MTLRAEVTARQRRYNAINQSIDWQLTPDDGRIKLHHLYSVEPKTSEATS